MTKNFETKPSIYDPCADKKVKNELGFDLIDKIQKYDAIVLAVAHDKFLTMNMADLKNSQKSIVFDLKPFRFDQVDARL